MRFCSLQEGQLQGQTARNHGSCIGWSAILREALEATADAPAGMDILVVAPTGMGKVRCPSIDSATSLLMVFAVNMLSSPSCGGRTRSDNRRHASVG